MLRQPSPSRHLNPLKTSVGGGHAGIAAIGQRNHQAGLDVGRRLAHLVVRGVVNEVGHRGQRIQVGARGRHREREATSASTRHSEDIKASLLRARREDRALPTPIRHVRPRAAQDYPTQALPVFSRPGTCCRCRDSQSCVSVRRFDLQKSTTQPSHACRCCHLPGSTNRHPTLSQSPPADAAQRNTDNKSGHAQHEQGQHDDTAAGAPCLPEPRPEDGCHEHVYCHGLLDDKYPVAHAPREDTDGLNH
ncbi:hypothetical protein PsYK624_044380 [Phanerochaete sordida]|uniref:Uncharacterized protein n=1 Tax=Phanerochaete sordida TaxID=48140 RepID=A0A9P3G5S9_9APHY|nr:hypothetical protein PsYK624_044380 [Phanerochaete sordida]